MKNYENEFTTETCHCCTGKKAAFTLAETLITVAILGVVAAITIPAIINHQTESANRTKLKKAMTTYEKALNQMIIENDIKSDAGIQALNTAGCTITTEYFKKVEGSGCRFKTADRIWWDITDIENPLVMLKDKYKEEEIATLKELAKKEDDREVFGMVGRLDDSIGVLRINDKGAETATPNKEYMTKLYNFMNKVENAAADGGGGNAGENEDVEEAKCNVECKVLKVISEMTECTEASTENCYRISGTSVYYYDENGSLSYIFASKHDCTSGTGENCLYSHFYSRDIPLDNGGTRDIEHTCDGEWKNCTTTVKDYIPLENGEGMKQIDHCGCVGEEINDTCPAFVYCYDNNYRDISCPTSEE